MWSNDKSFFAGVNYCNPSLKPGVYLENVLRATSSQRLRSLPDPWWIYTLVCVRMFVVGIRVKASAVILLCPGLPLTSAEGNLPELLFESSTATPNIWGNMSPQRLVQPDDALLWWSLTSSVVQAQLMTNYKRNGRLIYTFNHLSGEFGSTKPNACSLNTHARISIFARTLIEIWHCRSLT